MSKTGFHNMDMTARNTIDNTSMKPFAYSKMNKTRITFLNILILDILALRSPWKRKLKENWLFLNVLIAKQTGSSCKTSIHHQTTYKGVLTIFFSFTALSYKIGLIKTLIEGIFEINNNWRGFQNDFAKLTSTLRKNRFPQYLIKQIQKLLFKQN